MLNFNEFLLESESLHSEILNKLQNYINSVKLVDDEKLRTWLDMSIGDKKNVVDVNEDLPDSQAEPPKGIYRLSIIPVKKTDHYLMGHVSRASFSHDDYDNWQTERLDMIKSEFDSTKREPVIAIEGLDGLYSIIDGHHRIVVADELGRQSILALVVQNKIDKKMTWQSSLDYIAKCYLSAKAGSLRWTKERINAFISWIDFLTT